MRFFLGKDAAAVIREKQAFGGDDTTADGLIATYLAAHPGWTAPEVDQPTFDAAVVVIDPIPLRTNAISLLNTDTSPNSKFVRAVLLVVLDEINVIRALLPGPPAARTIAQLKTAIQNKLNSGAAD
jgi:hypothetical protein